MCCALAGMCIDIACSGTSSRAGAKKLPLHECRASRILLPREGAGGAISLQKRVEASWNAACPGQEILHGVQYLGTLADPNAYGGGMKQKLAAMDAAAHGYAGELSKDHPDGAVVEQLRKTLLAGA